MAMVLFMLAHPLHHYTNNPVLGIHLHICTYLPTWMYVYEIKFQSWNLTTNTSHSCRIVALQDQMIQILIEEVFVLLTLLKQEEEWFFLQLVINNLHILYFIWTFIYVCLSHLWRELNLLYVKSIKTQNKKHNKNKSPE